MTKTLRINRAGVIVVTPAQGTSHQCVLQNHTTYYYTSYITLIDPVLDDRGFIADHMEIDEFLKQQCTKEILSCEILAQTLAEKLYEFMVSINHYPSEVYMRITNIPSGSQAFIEATVKNEDWKVDRENYKGKKWRVKTYKEILELSNNSPFVSSMKQYCGQFLPEYFKVPTSEEEAFEIPGFNSWTWKRRLLTTDPLPKKRIVYRLKTLSELADIGISQLNRCQFLTCWNEQMDEFAGSEISEELYQEISEKTTYISQFGGWFYIKEFLAPIEYK